MAGGDLFATLLAVAENRGQGHTHFGPFKFNNDTLAGICDVGGDTFSKFILVAYGGTELTHHGIWGIICIVPVLTTGFFTTKLSTRFCRRIGASDPSGECHRCHSVLDQAD